ncbi:MAG: bifunctional phosphoribosyl-AMP cyclohydrolase/phosphoribosyl-ATP diphosphatase HisIE [marine benthic group bacterium]|nr:bifunctional phosphoribosyl-AMP cyclohydrolase/phosphoribosyl-ATP diphosphatase HisIE [Gemmatimonadota bacterium]
MGTDFDTNAIRFDPDSGLVPAIVQDAQDGSVLMLGWMNRESLERTLESGKATFYSRSRKRLWEKGESSGNTLFVASIAADCDSDAILVRAHPKGPCCHQGTRSCFDAPGAAAPPARATLQSVLVGLADVIEQRDRDRPEGSYTTTLLQAGVMRAAQKVAEEAAETALSAVAEPHRLSEESADLLYHLLVLWRAAGIDPDRVAEELLSRAR